MWRKDGVTPESLGDPGRLPVSGDPPGPEVSPLVSSPVVISSRVFDSPDLPFPRSGIGRVLQTFAGVTQG